MKLKYIKEIEGSAVCYGQTVKTGDVIDSSVWGSMAEVMEQKALRSGDWQLVIETPKEFTPKPKRKGK